MSIQDHVSQAIRSSIATKERTLADRDIVRRATIAALLVRKTVHSGGRILIMGNGGSQSDAQHFASELTGRFSRDVSRKGLSALCLPTNIAYATAWGNDIAFEGIFSREVEAHGRPGDCVVLISTSGQSPNILHAKKKARDMGLLTIALTGSGGGELLDCDIVLCVPEQVTPRIQEAHINLIHAMCGIIDDPREIELPFKALICDLDGTLAPTEPLWPETDRRFFSAIIGPEAWNKWRDTWLDLRHRRTQLDTILEQFLKGHERGHTPKDVAALKADRETFLLREYKNGLQPFAGADLLLRAARHMGIKVAIASGMSPRIIQETAQLFGWRVDAIASTHEVICNKPDPSVYRLALERLGIELTDTQYYALAVENDLAGATSAQAAHLTYAFIPDSEEREQAARSVGIHRTHVTLEEVLATLFGI